MCLFIKETELIFNLTKQKTPSPWVHWVDSIKHLLKLNQSAISFIE